MRIEDLARSLIELYSNDPKNHEIIETGIRDGEKLNEDLITLDEISKVLWFSCGAAIGLTSNLNFKLHAN